MVPILFLLICSFRRKIWASLWWNNLCTLTTPIKGPSRSVPYRLQVNIKTPFPPLQQHYQCWNIQEINLKLFVTNNDTSNHITCDIRKKNNFEIDSRKKTHFSISKSRALSAAAISNLASASLPMPKRTIDSHSALLRNTKFYIITVYALTKFQFLVTSTLQQPMGQEPNRLL